MIIASVHVRNLCGLLDATLNCDSLTALVGGNGCGKSTFLKALELFYSTTPRFSVEDLYNNDTSRDIQITVSYTDLNEQAQKLFAHYLSDDTLTITRVLSLADGKPSSKYYGSKLQNPVFLLVRQASNKVEARKIYNELRQRPEYGSLPAVTSADAAYDALAVFEQAHPELSERYRDDGQFFGFTEVAQGYLGRFTRLLPIPAVRDAGADAAEGRGSAITTLLDMVVRNKLAAREDLQTLKAETQQRYRQLMARENLPELDQMESDLSSLMQTFVAESGVTINWSGAGEIDFPMPRAEVRLSEHGYPSTVANTGHGLQRTFVMTMLQSLAAEQAITTDDSNATPSMPNLVLCIEEPELYQHPIRERNFARVLRQLATGHIAGVADKTQVIYTTHSSHFVGIDRFHQIRVFHKIDNGPDNPRITRVSQVTPRQVADEIGRAWNPGRANHGYSWESIQAKLHTIMTPVVNEGFFSDTVVLVEGEEDRGAILGVAYLLGHDLEEVGISIIPCGGKGNIDRPLVIFRQFGIKTFAVWDGDQGESGSMKSNHRLLRLLGEPVVDYPETQIGTTFACFEDRLQRTMLDEIGERDYSIISQRCHQEQEQELHGVETKNPLLIAQIIHEAAEQGLRCQTIEQIVERILEVKRMSSQDYFALSSVVSDLESELLPA